MSYTVNLESGRTVELRKLPPAMGARRASQIVGLVRAISAELRGQAPAVPTEETLMALEPIVQESLVAIEVYQSLDLADLAELLYHIAELNGIRRLIVTCARLTAEWAEAQAGALEPREIQS